ncbi:hypothetical protein NC652_027002 [Populus alba x Populus x berolinensis]|nr:hypothetical protein NC652_027002 [Populus alba x Populus x berolinensis]
MEGIMFKLFEKQPNWTLKQLIQETDQPEGFSMLGNSEALFISNMELVSKFRITVTFAYFFLFLNISNKPGQMQFVKDMLKDLCVYNNKGSNQGSYELKPEYKKSNEEPAPE